MSTATQWYLIIGVLLVTMAIASSFVKDLPLSTAVIYLIIGIGLGPHGIGLFTFSAVESAAWLEIVTEIVILISLFAAGLKLRNPLKDPIWRGAVKLALVSMVITVGMIAAFGIYVLEMQIGAAILLGAILAPTDPVLASGVQVHGPGDKDRLRFSLTGEAGLNDGTAFPFVMLGLGLLGAHDLGKAGLNWVLVDVLWAGFAGLAVGAFAGTITSQFATYLRRRHRENVILDDFLALGLIALSYGVAIAIHAYGFLAVFAAGVALRRLERLQSQAEQPDELVGVVSFSHHAEPEKIEPEKTTAVIAKSALLFDEQLERIGEVTTVLLVGAMLSFTVFSTKDVWLIPFLLLFVRPASVWLGLIGDPSTHQQRHYLSWFGIRGIGSLYYLMYAIHHGVPGDLAERLSSLVFAVVAISIFVHGVSVTPLMGHYRERFEKGKSAERQREMLKGPSH